MSWLHLRSRIGRVCGALLLLTTLGVSSVPAAEKVAVVSLRASDQLFNDITYLMKATGTDALAQLFLPQVQQYFKGVNGKQPIGLVLQMDNGQLVPLVFIPVTDLQTVLASLRDHLGEPADAGNGVYELQGPQPLFVKEQNGWAFVGQTAQSLTDLPAQPEKLLEGLDQRYTLGVRAYVDKVPTPYKQILVDRIREGMDANANAGAGDSEKQAAVEQVQRFVDESETLTFGLQISPQDREVFLGGTVKPVAGSKMATDIDAARNLKTAFSGFNVPGAAASGNLAAVIPADQIPQMLESLDQFQQKTLTQVDGDDKLDDSTRAGAKQLVTTFFQIARSTVKTGRLDSCTSVILQPQAVSIVSGSHVASGSEVEDAVKQLVKLAEADSRIAFSNVKLNAAEHDGVRYHTMGVPVPKDEKARKALGETMQITVAAGKDTAYIGLGPGGVDQLRKLVDASKKAGESTVDPFTGQLSMIPVLEFAKSIEPNPLLESLIQMLENHRELDQIKVRNSVDDEGLAYRFTLEEGVLKLIGQVVPFLGMQMGG